MTAPTSISRAAAGALRLMPPRRAFGIRGDTTFSILLGVAAGIIVLNTLLLLFSILERGMEAIVEFGPGFLVGTTWNPVTHDFGVLPAIYGTVVVAAIGLVLAVPIGVGAAIFLVELAPRWLSSPVSFLIEMLAAIPSVIIGLWGLFVVVPLIRQFESAVGKPLGFLPIFSGPAFGIGLLAAGVLLAVMVLPIITAVSRDVIRAVPQSQREAMLALGATRWETIARAVLPYGASGIVGAIILALGRALGETLAVSMVVGNTFKISPSLFAPGTTLASLIATQFREADTPLYLSALMAAGMVLFAITILVNIAARILIWRLNTGGRRA
ncbi:MAG: phosphate transporter permease subunit PstC [Chloroflexi bacterium]|nr:phosphate transporter permease subunit PstC [Chloroflexota bacterium]